MADESPESQLWREAFMQQLRSKPHASNYIDICKDAKDAADMAVKFYREAFPSAPTSYADIGKPMTAPPAKPAKSGAK
jgi:4-hydroxyphenylpyruvate dioxygenase-like putative hemolysin